MPRGKNYVNQNKGMFLQAGGRQKVTEPCKYGAACNRRDCIYSHEVAAETAAAASADAPCMAYLAGLCAFTKGCRRRHPSAAECERLVARYGALPCRFGTECRTTGCLYNHDKVPPAQCLPAAIAMAVQPTPVVSKSGTSSLAAWMPTSSSSLPQNDSASASESARHPVPPSMLQHSRPGAPLPPQSTPPPHAVYYPSPMMMPGGYYSPQQQQEQAQQTPYYEKEDEAPPYHGGGMQPWYPPPQPFYGAGSGTGPQSTEGEPYYNGGGDESYSYGVGGGPPFPSHGGGGAFPMTTIGSWKPAPIAQPHQHAFSSYNTYTANNSNYPPPPPQQPAAAASSWESQFPELSASTSAWESQFPALLSNAPQSSSSSSSTIGNKNSNNTRH